ncbi:MAG: hypothetical protein ACFB22_06065 [Rhodothalassiaceae bacterium]
MTRIFAQLLAGLMLALILGLSAPAQEQLQTIYGGPDGDVWQPAPTPPGAQSWVALQDLELEERLDGEWIVFDPIFGPKVEALNGRLITINGFMRPLENARAQKHFLLTAYPLSCPFHTAGGASTVIEVIAERPVHFTYEPVLMQGRFELVDTGETGLFYRLTAAREVAQ